MAFNSTVTVRCDGALMHSTACFASDSGQALMV